MHNTFLGRTGSFAALVAILGAHVATGVWDIEPCYSSGTRLLIAGRQVTRLLHNARTPATLASHDPFVLKVLRQW